MTFPLGAIGGPRAAGDECPSKRAARDGTPNRDVFAEIVEKVGQETADAAKTKCSDDLASPVAGDWLLRHRALPKLAAANRKPSEEFSQVDGNILLSAYESAVPSQIAPNWSTASRFASRLSQSTDEGKYVPQPRDEADRASDVAMSPAAGQPSASHVDENDAPADILATGLERPSGSRGLSDLSDSSLQTPGLATVASPLSAAGFATKIHVDQIETHIAASIVACVTEPATGSIHAIERSTPDRRQILRFRIEPESLGVISIRMRISQLRVDIKIEAQSAEALELLNDARGRLTGAIAETGVSVDSLDVARSDNISSQGQDWPDDRGSGSGGGQGFPSQDAQRDRKFGKGPHGREDYSVEPIPDRNGVDAVLL